MNSVKTVAVVAVFLGVVYGVYQVINNSEVYVEDDSAILDENGDALVGAFGEEIDPANLSDEELDALLTADYEDDSSGDSSMDISFDDVSMDFDTDDGDESVDATTETASFGSFAPSTPEQPPSQPPSLQPSTLPAAKAAEAIQTGNQAVQDAANSFGTFTREKNAEFTSKVNDVAEASANSFAGAVDNVAKAAGFGTQNADFTSQPVNPAQAMANSFAAKAEEATTNANNAFNQAPNLAEKAADATNTFATKATEQAASLEQEAIGTAANAFSNAANSFFGPKKKTPPAKPTTEQSVSTERTTTTAPIDFASKSQPKSAPPADRSNIDLAGELAKAKILIEQGKHREALEQLSALHNDERLSGANRKELLKWLDPLAGKVIYSTEHLVMNGYTVRSGDTLEKVAAQHSISSQLLYNINRVNISNPRLLTPGTVLKIVPGPFSATIDTTSSQLTLFLNDMYAGRFVVSMGEASPKQGGRFTINRKSDAGQEYTAANGSIIASNDPGNPYGKYFLQLDNGAAIHSTANAGDANDSRGSISLSPIDAEDVYGILTAGSQVIVR